MQPEPYSYFPIDSEYLRLLKRDFSQGDGLHFTLRLVVRDPPSGIRPPRYIALSYTWGAEDATEPIYINGRRLWIRPNLWSCLSFLTQEPSVKDEWIWCDAICIDQKYYKERNSQVQLMGRTYWDALYVCVWLGVSASYTSPGNTSPSESSKGDSFKWEASIKTLVDHPYWLRAWIVQEYMLAKDVKLWCGSNHIGWQEFHELLVLNDLKSCRAYTLGQSRMDGSMNRDNVSNFYRRRGRPLATLLQEHSQTLCQDPRDRVFSLLGMVPGKEERLLHYTFPDYGMKIETVGLLTITHLQQQYGSRIRNWEGIFLALDVKSTEQRDSLVQQSKELRAWIKEEQEKGYWHEFDRYYQQLMQEEAGRIINRGPLPRNWAGGKTRFGAMKRALQERRRRHHREIRPRGETGCLQGGMAGGTVSAQQTGISESVPEQEPQACIPEDRRLIDAQATDDGPPRKKARCDVDHIT